MFQDGDRGRVYLSYRQHLEHKGLSPRSLESYCDCLLNLSRWTDELERADLASLTASDLEDFQIWLSKQPSPHGGTFSSAHRGKHVAVVRDLFAFMQRECLVLGNPAAALKYPKIQRKLRRDVLSTQELKRLLELPVADDEDIRDAVAIRLLALSGLRARELCGLNVEDLNIPERELIVRGGKGAKDRLTFFDPGTRKLLVKYLAGPWHRLQTEPVDALLVGSMGGRASYHDLRKLVADRAKDARIKKHLTPHGLRHTFCTLLLAHGCGIKQIAELVGHSSLGTTAKYTRVEISELSRVYRAAHPRSSS